MRDVLLDGDLLEEADLTTPDVVQLFELLGCFGYDCKDLPLSIDDAVAHARRNQKCAGKYDHHG